jgi:hypothetical protein
VKLTALRGDHPETGCALVLLGRTENALGRYLDAERSLKRAVAILERQPDAGMHLRNALALLATALVHQNRAVEAAPILERVQRLSEPPPHGGPAPLHVLVGGMESAVTARSRVVQ